MSRTSCNLCPAPLAMSDLETWVTGRTQVDVAKIVLHEAYDPNAFIDLLDADTLTGQHGRDVDAFAVHGDVAASGHQHIAIVQWVGEFG